MKKVLLIFTCFVICSFTLINDEFDLVIANQKDENLKLKLQKFKNGGIERAIEFVENEDTTHIEIIDIEKIIQTAQSYLGARHVMGGTSKSGIDCSGLVMMSLKSCGINAAHNSHEQGRYGNVVSRMDSLKRGDLVFFINSYKTNYLLTHSGIYIGNGKFIHASANAGVTITELKMDYWKTKFIFGTRLTN